jgi:hypothetical protein
MAVLVVVFLGNQVWADTIEVRVSDGNDDAEEHVTSADAGDPMGSVDITSSDLELGAEGGGGDLQQIGIRFQGINILPLSTINSAFVQFTTDEIDDEVTSVRIYGELSPNAAPYSAATNNVTNRTKTTAFVDWSNIPIWELEGEAGPDQRTPNLGPVLQEIINQPGWAAGNALALIIDANPGGERTAESFNGVPAAAPLLSVDFIPIPEPSTVALASVGLLTILAYGSRRRLAM